MNIDISKKGNSVEVAITQSILYMGDVTYSFQHSCGVETYAALLASTLRQSLGNEVRRIRKDAYLAGWADKRTRRNQETFFPAGLGYRYGRR